MYNWLKIENKDIFSGGSMFKYENEFLTFVEVEQENLKYAKLIQEQLCCINMGLKLSIQFMLQGYESEDDELKRLLLKLSAEELGNYELIVKVIDLLSGKKDYIKKVCGTVLFDVDIVTTNDPCTNLLSNIALSEQAKTIYCELNKQIGDIKVKNLLSFIIKREEEFSSELREAFNKIQRKKVKEGYKTDKEPKICFSTIKPKLRENAYEEFKKTPPPSRF